MKNALKLDKLNRPMVVLQMLFTLCMFILLSTLGANGLAKAQAAPIKKTVLILFPYQVDLPVSMIAAQAIREEFGSVADFNLDVYYEYLDLNRFPDPVYQKRQFDLFTAKYKSKQVDLVIVTSEAMLNLWLAHRADILPNTPIVFFDITTDRLDVLSLPADVTGVSGVVDYSKSVQWVLDKMPTVNEIVIVHGVGQTDQDYIQPVLTLQEKMKGQIKFTDLSDLPLSEIKQRVAELPKTSIVLYHLMFEGADGNRYRPIDVARELVTVSSVAVISGYDQFIDTGTLGGYMYSIDQQARDAAQISLRVLRGEAINTIPIVKNRSDRFIFDHLALLRFGIPLSLLPPDSVIKNRQYSFWELYRTQIIFVTASFTLLLMVVAFLGVVTQHLTKARADLSQLNANLESQIQERTVALRQNNRELEFEITERKQTEELLQKANGQLLADMEKIGQLQTELREQAIRDPLTGLFNRRYMNESMGREIMRAERENEQLSFIISDIDHFKMINDTYGHQVGDKFLVEVASLIKNNTRGSDIACRYGGEEFLLVLPDAAMASAAKCAEEIRKKFAKIIVYHEGKELKLTASFGVATYPEHGKKAEEIILKADKAMYKSKQDGRNQVTVWEEEATNN